MTDLYTRAEELNELRRLLEGDVNYLRPHLGERLPAVSTSNEEQTNRRAYIRAVFALIEALTEQYKQLFLALDEHGTIALAAGVREALSERQYTFRDNGTVTQREQYLQLQTKIRAIWQTAGSAFGESIHVSFGDGGWQSFQEAVKARNQITHPKSSNDCYIDEDVLTVVDQAENWFHNLS